MVEPAAKPGRPSGQTKANGYATSAGRPTNRPDDYDARLQAWREWWQARPRNSACTAAVVAARMESTAGTIANYVKARQPSETTLRNLESLCGAYGYVPPTSHNQFL